MIINSNISGFKNMTQKSSWAMTKYPRMYVIFQKF